MSAAYKMTKLSVADIKLLKLVASVDAALIGSMIELLCIKYNLEHYELTEAYIIQRETL